MLVRAIVPLLAVLALAGPGFDGCSSSPSGGSIPPGTTVACFGDSDCPAMGCAQVACVASQCMTTAPFRDGDGDGHAPPPCGDDCDDTDALVFPGAAERCNGRDDDCDGMIDEGAPPSATATPLATTSGSIAMAAVGSSIVLTDGASAGGGLSLRLADYQGRLGAPRSVTTSSIDAADVAATSTGGVVVVAQTDTTGSTIDAYAFTLTAGVLSVQPPMTIATFASASRATGLRVEGVGSAFVVVWDDASMARSALMPSWAAPVPLATGVASTVPLDVATDGTSIAVPVDASTVAFLSPTDGSVMHRQTFPSELASDPLSGGAHDYLVAFHDATDHQLAHLSETAVLTTHAAPPQGAGLPLRIDETPLGPLVTRLDMTGTPSTPSGAWAIVLNDALDTVVSRFDPTMISPGRSGTAMQVDVASSSMGTAVLTNFGPPGAVLTVLACMPH